MNIPLPFHRIHGQVRGLDPQVARSPQFEGRFGRLFRTLPAADHDDDDLVKLAKAMVAEHEDAQTPENADPPDDEENVGDEFKEAGIPAIPAGFTYFGQFIDHDLTFDPSSSLEKQNDPNALVDFRTPRFDLDNLYGRGPDDQPYLYQDDGVRLALGRKLTGNSNDPNARDLPRCNPDAGAKRALIGDPRNDENVIVSQLQATFLRFHNRMADVLKAKGPDDFHRVQKAVRWHYQWVVLNDFLPTVINRETLQEVLPHVVNGTTVLKDPPKLVVYKPRKEPFIPVEFSVAAYRFGHSMVRPIYRLNEVTPPKDAQKDLRLPIFSATGESLVGFREFPSTWAVDWRLFFDLRGGSAPKKGPDRIQPAYKIDTSLVNPLGALPQTVARGKPSLAERNLFRGKSMGLPSGQAVARALGVPVVADESLRVGKANEDGRTDNPKLTDVSEKFADNAPLWYYVLAESQQVFQKNDTTIRLGPVGGRIVAEVFAGLLLHDRYSFLNQDPSFRPHQDFLGKDGRFGIAQLIAQAMKV